MIPQRVISMSPHCLPSLDPNHVICHTVREVFNEILYVCVTLGLRNFTEILAKDFVENSHYKVVE